MCVLFAQSQTFDRPDLVEGFYHGRNRNKYLGKVDRQGFERGCCLQCLVWTVARSANLTGGKDAKAKLVG